MRDLGLTLLAFEVCDAYTALEWDYNSGGVLHERPSCVRRRESCAVQLARIGYRPSPTFSGWPSLSERAREIYTAAVVRLGLPCPACEDGDRGLPEEDYPHTCPFVLVDGLGQEQEREYESRDDAENEASGLPGTWTVRRRGVTS